MASKPAPPPPAPKASSGRIKRDPNSKNQQRLAKRTEENLTTAAKVFRDIFIAEYLVDYNAYQAYRRAGGTAKAKNGYKIAYEMTLEPYVCKKIRECIDLAEEKQLINRQRIIAGLVREANYNGMSASHGARVTSFATLAKIMGMDQRQVAANLSMRGGILIVPQTDDLQTWEARSASAQRALKEAVRE